MFNISSFLKRVTNIVDSGELRKKEIQYIVQTHTGFLCPLDAIDFQKDTVVLNINPTYKMALFVKKDEILENLKPLGISDIR